MYRTLRAEMARYGVKPKDIAETLGVTIKTAREKLNGKRPLDLKEAKKIRDKHFPRMTLDELYEWEEAS